MRSLAGAGDARHDGERPSGTSRSTFLRLFAAPLDADRFGVAIDRRGRVGIAATGQEVAGRPARHGFDRGGRLGHDLAAEAGARTDVDPVIRAADRRFVVFDDDQRVADVAQRLEALEQPVVVRDADRRSSRMYSTPIMGADLGGESDALGFAAGEVAARRSRVR